MNTTRLLYIDKLKALAMILVVWGHTMYFCIYHEHTETIFDPLLSIICTFHVPLFFFLSGVVISTPPDFRKFLGKSRRFLVPMLVVGFINALLIGLVADFFLNDGHNGYWYLLTLTLFYLLLLPFRYKERLTTSKTLDILLALAIWVAAYFSTGIDSVIISALNPWAVFAYWPFFMIGFFCRKYSLLPYITGKTWLTVLLLLAYLLLLIISFPQIKHLPLIIDFTSAVLAIAALVALFYHFSDSQTFIDRQLLLIGGNTLQIYIYHYFFIRFIDLSFLIHHSLLIEIVVTSLLTILIVYGSITISVIYRKLIACIRR